MVDQAAQPGGAGTRVWRQPDRPIVISRHAPLTVIGQRINPTGRPLLVAALRSGDMTIVQDEARRQVKAGAALLDVNVYLPPRDGGHGDEAALLSAAIAAVAAVTAVPLVVDSADTRALLAGLAACPGRAVVNSLTGVPRVLDELLPAIAARGAAAIALPIDGDGIPPDVAGRLRIAERILDRAVAAGLAPYDIVVDAVALPAARHPEAGAVTLATIGALAHDLGVNTVVAASNVSFGDPPSRRGAAAAAFVAMAMAAGLSCVIGDPLSPAFMAAVAAGNRLLGRETDPSSSRSWGGEA